MVTETLHDDLIDSGEELLKQIDAANVRVDAALWLYFPDIDSWKLMLSMPEIIKKGPKATYREVQKAFSKMKGERPISLDDVSIAKKDAPILKLLRIVIKTGAGISNIRFSRNTINGVIIEDAYIYRLI